MCPRYILLPDKVVGIHAEKHEKFKFPVPTISSKTLISFDDVSVERGGVPVLCGVMLQLEPGTRAAIVGDNGAGKTTLLQVSASEAKKATMAPHSLMSRALAADHHKIPGERR